MRETLFPTIKSWFEVGGMKMRQSAGLETLQLCCTAPLHLKKKERFSHIYRFHQFTHFSEKKRTDVYSLFSNIMNQNCGSDSFVLSALTSSRIIVIQYVVPLK